MHQKFRFLSAILGCAIPDTVSCACIQTQLPPNQLCSSEYRKFLLLLCKQCIHIAIAKHIHGVNPR